MKRFLLFLALTIVALIGLVYTLLFSAIGNALIAPVAQKKLSEALHVKVKLDPFTLRHDRFELSLWLDEANRIDLAGNFSLLSKRFDIAYRVRLNRLESLEPMIRRPLFGTLRTQGSIKGDPKHFTVEGDSDLANSQNSYRLSIKDLQPENLDLEIQNAQSEALLGMAGIAPYVGGAVNVSAHIASFDPSALQGEANLSMPLGSYDAALIERDFNATLPQPNRFALQARSTLQGAQILSSALLHSALMRLNLEQSSYTPKSAELQGLFTLELSDLAALEPLAKRPLQGSARFEGTLHRREQLRIDANSSGFGGMMHCVLDQKQAHVRLERVESLKLLHLLTYPELFDARIDGVLEYDLSGGSATLEAALTEGRMMRNAPIDLLARSSRFDLYQERFEGTLRSTLNQERILSDLALRSRFVTLRDSALELRHRAIRANLEVSINATPFTLKVRGTLDQPRMSLEASEALKHKAAKTLEKELENLFQNLIK